MFIAEKTVLGQSECHETLNPNLWELSADLKNIFDKQLLCDIVLCANGRNIGCHKDLLSIRSKWFSLKINQESSSEMNLIRINEKSHILDAVLVYIYTGNLKLLETLNIPIVDLRQAADKYGLLSLKEILSDIIKSENTSKETKSIEFVWNAKVDGRLTCLCDCTAMEDFTLYGSDKWGLEMQPLFLRDCTCIIGIYLKRETINEIRKIAHTVYVTIHLVDSSGLKHLSFKEELIVSEDRRYKIAEFSPETEKTENASKIFPSGLLTLACELTICGKLSDFECFQLKGHYRRWISTELLTLSDDMYQMLKLGKHTDTTIDLKGSVFLKAHSYVLVGRSSIPICLLSKLGDIIGFGSVVWRSFVFFMYTGQTRYLDDHMRVIYRALSKLKLIESVRRYSRLLANNLNFDNAFGILCEAVKNEDTDLASSAANFLARNSSALLDPQLWINIASDKSTLAIFNNKYF